MFKEIEPNGPVRFGLVSVLCLGALLYFDGKPKAQAVAFLSVVLGASLLARLAQWRRDYLARRWTRVEAQFESGAQTEIRTKGECLYRVQVNYSYSMEGSYYGGFYQTYFRDELEAAKLLNDLKQRRFWIRVNPADRDQSSVIPEEL